MKNIKREFKVGCLNFIDATAFQTRKFVGEIWSADFDVIQPFRIKLNDGINNIGLSVEPIF